MNSAFVRAHIYQLWKDQDNNLLEYDERLPLAWKTEVVSSKRVKTAPY